MHPASEKRISKNCDGLRAEQTLKNFSQFSGGVFPLLKKFCQKTVFITFLKGYKNSNLADK